MPNPPSSTGIPVIPAKRTGREIYDSIMREIEPELLSAELPFLEERYQHDTPEQQKKRAERYIKAMDEYEKRYAQYRQEREGKARAFKLGSVHFVEKQSADDEQVKMRSLESALGGFSSSL
ncbi:MAG: hypothetical protein PHX93_03955 [Candidatus Peribacteraceae bacterium]|jgi:hypothetical protein|nr:hypothetical protein [Candidatus Peribacteraceae bacterium]